ncbi:MAG: replication-associated recombination protein A [Ruminococcaceae bacterium]|nr:replication-associated recombination protein A [Oscillospiraceae bacterium]
MPLADRIRPTTLDEVVGQRHILAKGRPLYNIINKGKIPNMIFYGSSGVGKTTVANIIAKQTSMTLYKLNGTQASTADIKEIVSSLGTFAAANGILLFLDEIQYLNKKQQQTLLEYLETGEITLIASTTENPYFYVYNAILSRSTVFEFKPITAEDVIPAVERAFSLMGDELGCRYEIEDGVIEHIAYGCGGDVRKAVNTVELCALSSDDDKITMDIAQVLTQKSNMNYDRDGDKHYDILSGLQKSIRGSDENAALHYMARLIAAGDITSLCRRLLVIASEDIGLAYPMAVPIVKACVDSALQLGLPEARIPLAEATVLLATSPKSNSAYMAIAAAMEDIEAGRVGDIPRHLQNTHYDGEGAAVKGQHYLYPHDYPNHYVEQQYLPDILKDRVYYQFGDNKMEQQAKAYRDMIKGKK